MYDLFGMLTYEFYESFLVTTTVSSVSQFSVSVCLVITSLQRLNVTSQNSPQDGLWQDSWLKFQTLGVPFSFQSLGFTWPWTFDKSFQGMHFRSQVCIARSLNTSKFILFATELWSDRSISIVSVFSHDKSRLFHIIDLVGSVRLSYAPLGLSIHVVASFVLALWRCCTHETLGGIRHPDENPENKNRRIEESKMNIKTCVIPVSSWWPCRVVSTFFDRIEELSSCFLETWSWMLLFPSARPSQEAWCWQLCAPKGRFRVFECMFSCNPRFVIPISR